MGRLLFRTGLIRTKIFSKISVPKPISLFLVGSLVAGSVWGVASLSGHALAQGSINVTGTVTNSSGGGIQNVSVYATDPGTSTVEYGPVSTASNGTYDLQVNSGTFDFHFSPPNGSGLGAVVNSNVTVTADQVMNVQLTPASYTFSGTLRDSSGTAIPNYAVYIAGTNTQLTTDSSGHFSKLLSAGKYSLSGGVIPTGTAASILGSPTQVSMSGSTSNGPFDLTNGDLTEDVTIPTAHLTVTVYDNSGNLVQGATVRSAPNAGTMSWLASGTPAETSINAYVTTGTTNASGVANVVSLVGAQYTQPQGQSGTPGNICVTYPGNTVTSCLPQSTTITGDTSLTFTEPPVHTFSGTLTNSAGTIIPNYAVYIAGTNTQVTTDSNGHFSISLAAGKYGLSGGVIPSGAAASAMGSPTQVSMSGSNSNGPFDLTNGDLNQNITLPTATLTATVKDNQGNVISGAVVKSAPNAGTMSWFASGSPAETSINAYATSGTSNSSGVATVITLKGAEYTQPQGQTASGGNLCVTYPDNSFDCIPQSTTITGDTNITFTKTITHTFSGTLTDSAGTAIPNYSVYIAGTNTKLTTDSSGHFTISLAAGKYSLSGGVIPTGTAATILGSPTEVSMSGSTSNGPFDLTSHDLTQQTVVLPTANITVTVKDSSGNPIQGATITSKPRAGTMSWLPSGSPAETSINAYITSATTNSSGVATVVSLVGAYYAQNQGQTGTDANLCATYPDTTTVCIPQPITITGGTNITFQKAPAIPAAPTGLTAPTPTNGNPSLTWNAVSGASSYNIYRNGSKIGSSTTNSYSDTSAPEGTDSYYVTAVNGGGESTQSNTINVLVDRTSPVITYTVTPQADSNGHNTGKVVVSFTCVDASSGVASCTSPITVDNEGIGQTVTGTATDNAGNSKTIHPSASLLNQAVNAGGNSSASYAADTGYYGGSTYSTTATVGTDNVINPAPQDVYQTVRYGNTFSYTFGGLTAGNNYTLMLHFNELYWGTQSAGGGVGSRVFNVAVNGQSALSNYDIYKTAGGVNRAVTEELAATADADGKVTVQFSTVTDNAVVSGIQVFNGTLPPQAPHPTHIFSTVINAGGLATGDFSDDTDYSGGSAYTSSSDVDTSGVTNPAPQDVYKTARYGNFTYTIPDLTPNTSYHVRLDFNEPYWGANGNIGGTGSRVFNVSMNGNTVLNNFDIYATAGAANKAVAEDFTVTSDSQGKITIQFTTVSDNAIVSGIEVTKP